MPYVLIGLCFRVDILAQTCTHTNTDTDIHTPLQTTHTHSLSLSYTHCNINMFIAGILCYYIAVCQGHRNPFNLITTKQSIHSFALLFRKGINKWSNRACLPGTFCSVALSLTFATLRAADPGSIPTIHVTFSGSSHTSDLIIGSQAATLPGAW